MNKLPLLMRMHELCVSLLYHPIVWTQHFRSDQENKNIQNKNLKQQGQTINIWLVIHCPTNTNTNRWVLIKNLKLAHNNAITWYKHVFLKQSKQRYKKFKKWSITHTKSLINSTISIYRGLESKKTLENKKGHNFQNWRPIKIYHTISKRKKIEPNNFEKCDQGRRSEP